jgi:cytidine deaminase
MTASDPVSGSDRTPQLTHEELGQLQKAARAAITNAYAPYSGFSVGAAVLTESGQIYLGSNVENASYGLTICAERSAIFQAVSVEGPVVRIRALAVAANSDMECTPCGACRQVMSEFSSQDALVSYSHGKDWVVMRSGELLPNGFTFKNDRQGR